MVNYLILEFQLLADFCAFCAGRFYILKKLHLQLSDASIKRIGILFVGKTSKCYNNNKHSPLRVPIRNAQGFPHRPWAIFNWPHQNFGHSRHRTSGQYGPLVRNGSSPK